MKSAYLIFITVAVLALVVVLPHPAAAAGQWVVHTHPCPGLSRTDALHRDPDGTLWVGCGTTQNGTGLYVSFDGGPTWQKVTTNPADR